MTPDLNLWPIGNCQVSALVDARARFVWGCAPRVDGDPLFSALINGDDPDSGFWAIELESCAAVTQRYIRNTPVLVTRMEDDGGNAIEITDFCPRATRNGRTYRPIAWARRVEAVAGSPRIVVRLRPHADWGARAARPVQGSNHLRYDTATPLRLSTDAPIGLIADERPFRVERPHTFFLGPDEGFDGPLDPTVKTMLSETIGEWKSWVRGLATPPEWQEAVIRAAITLKLCQHEDTGAIVAALDHFHPRSMPNSAAATGIIAICWVRDAYYTVEALNRHRRAGRARILSGCICAISSMRRRRRQHSAAVRRNAAMRRLEERTRLPRFPGYRGMGPVRVGNAAYTQKQHDAYGQIVLVSAQAFVDGRLFRPSGRPDFETLERVGERAWACYDQPDAGLWELRTKSHVHTYSAVMCWAACDRLARVAEEAGAPERAPVWRERATTMRARILEAAWRPDTDTLSATFKGDERDASLLQLLDLRFLEPDDPRFTGTLAATEAALRRGPDMLRYATADDFGEPETAFTVCSFWLIEALALTGRRDEARELFERMLARRTPSGLLSEDADFRTGELWGNFPQTYSLVGIINSAVLLSKPWSAVL